jgi:bifunctional DNase/RNase
MVEAKIENLFFSTKGFVVMLRPLGDERVIPIYIGAQEAQAIAAKMGGIEVTRPLTHDLFTLVLDNLDCMVTHIEICDVRDNTFYARLFLERKKQKFNVDCRPSDALALALRFEAEIYIEEHVLHNAGIVLNSETPPDDMFGSDSEAEDAPDPLPSPIRQSAHKTPKEPQTPYQRLQSQLDQAVSSEDYEEAARIRDEIRKTVSDC